MARRRERGTSLMTLLGMAGGAAIGAAIGLVYSPSTGEENRRHLQEWANARFQEATNKAQQQASRAAEWTNARTTEVRDKAQQAISEAQDQVARVVPGGSGPEETGGNQC